MSFVVGLTPDSPKPFIVDDGDINKNTALVHPAQEYENENKIHKAKKRCLI